MKNEEISKNIVGEKEYMKIHKDLNDSIILWSSLKLETWRNYKIYEDVIINKIICFNLFKNKFVTASLERNFENPKLDGITYIYGVKIDSNWYFFQGAHIVLPREMYQSDVSKPLSFEKLHEIALKEVFSGYLKEKKPIVPFWKFWVKQEYEIDEQYFMKHWNYYGCMQKNNKDEYSQVCSNGMIDSLIMLNVYDNWRDKTERTFMNTKELWEYYYKTKFPL